MLCSLRVPDISCVALSDPQCRAAGTRVEDQPGGQLGPLGTGPGLAGWGPLHSDIFPHPLLWPFLRLRGSKDSVGVGIQAQCSLTGLPSLLPLFSV